MKAAAGRQKRSIWWRVHQWAGLKVGLFMTFILATGTIATLSHEIDWLLTPEMRVASQAGPHVSFGTLVASARAAAGDARLERVSAPVGQGFAAEAIALTRNGDRFRIQLDPWTAEIRGITPWFNAQRLLRELHRHLMLPVKWGLPFVAALSLPLLASVISAPFVYKKWWRGFLRLPRRLSNRPGEARRFIGDLHRFVGLWSLWFVALIGLTGLWYLVEWGGGDAPLPQATVQLAPAQVEGAALDRLVAAALRQYPDLRVTSVHFPDGKPGGVMLMGQADALLVRERANAILLDPADASVVHRLRGEQLSLHQRISEAADPLHFGNWGGLPTKLAWFVFGAALTGLSLTGTLIFAKRLGRADERREPRLMTAMWRGMGIFAWPSLALVLIGMLLAVAALIA